ncbi:hypothetical protein ACC674_38110, partial [Rhizobium ruizarguesonis]
AAIVAERVRLAIEAAEIPLPSGDFLKVTASFGCAGLANEASNRNFEDLVKRAAGRRLASFFLRWGRQGWSRDDAIADGGLGGVKRQV